MSKCFDCGDELETDENLGYCDECWRNYIDALEAEYTIGGTVVSVGLTAALIIAVGTVILNLFL